MKPSLNVTRYKISNIESKDLKVFAEKIENGDFRTTLTPTSLFPAAAVQELLVNLASTQKRQQRSFFFQSNSTLQFPPRDLDSPISLTFVGVADL